MAKIPKSRGKAANTSKVHGKFRVHFGVASKHRKVDLSDMRIKSGPGNRGIETKMALARRIALQGFDDETIAKITGTSLETLDYLKAMHPELEEAIDSGRTACDAEVVATLFKLAVGYEREVCEVAGKDAQCVKYNKYFAPELGAIKHWLNSRSTKFRDVQRSEVTGKGGKPLMPKESNKAIIDSIVGLVRPKPDNAPVRDKAKAKK